VDSQKTRQALLQKFRQVCSERVETILESFSGLLAEPSDSSLVDKLMREVHTLKGELRIMGFSGGGKMVHALEDALKKIRDEGFPSAAGFRDEMTDCLDAVTSLVTEGREPDVDEFCRRLRSWEEEKPVAAHKPSTSPAAGKPAPATDDKPVFSVADVVRVSGSKLDGLADLAGDLFTSYLNLRDLGQSLKHLQSAIDTLGSTLKTLSLEHADINQLRQLADGPAVELPWALAQFRRQLQDRTSGMANSLEQVIEQVRQLRLLPIATLFDRYKKAARDLAREHGRRLEVHVQGGSTLVDRSVLDALSDMLLHMIRNSVDHGLEDAEERRRAGKPATGNLFLRARLAGDRLVVEVADDGRGISVEKVRQEGIARGLLPAEEAANLDDQAVLELIFSPGFSTARQTTELSGRGVGMDVVKNRIQEFGGVVHVRSRPGEGTSFSLELPTSVAITRVLIFRSAGRLFTIMATFIDRIVRITPQELLESGGGQAVVIAERTIPVVSAAELLDLAALPLAGPERLAVVVLAHGGKFLGLVVDELVGERELTIKPLGRFLEGVRGLSGAAMLEDGTAIPLLHAGALVALAGRARVSVRSAPPESAERPRRILLVEDSLITRELERSLLTSLGLEVIEAGDGSEAMRKLAEDTFDMIISDVEMPRMNGFELTSRVKGDSRLSRIPVILVTTRGSPEDRHRGLQAGADAYVVKSDFNSRDFIETVQRFLT